MADSPAAEPSTTSAPPLPPVPPKEMKKANKPFLVHQRYLEKQRQQSTNPSTRSSPARVGSTIKWILLALLTSSILSRAVTQTWLWNYQGKWSNPHQIQAYLFPPKPLLLTELDLSRYDGTDLSQPLYIGIDGDVYDVSEGGRGSYGPGGAYHIFAGRDAARAFVTGCFQTHLTHDLRGFTEKQLKTLATWKSFYDNHANYRKVGKVVHPPIDPSTPIPEPCTGGSAQPDSVGKKST